MCGIFGYYDRHSVSIPVEQLVQMGRVIEHRGPDDQGIYQQKGLALGNQRLSIIDIAHGHQPFVSDDGQIVLVQNGEIFNHLELAEELKNTPFACRTHSDTEVLLRLYEKEGIGFLSRLNGMFAIAIWDARQQSLYLIRDRLGVKPLFVADDGQRLLFGSEIKSILAGGWPARPNYEALDNYFSLNYVAPPQTAFLGVKHVMAGHYLRLTPHKVESVCWWDLAHIEQEERSESSWTEEFLSLLDDAVRLRLRSDVPVGAFLSGGVDSSTIVGLMAKHMDYPLKTFCIGFNDPRFDESAFAAQAASRFGTTHIMERVDADMLSTWSKTIYHCDQPHGDVSFMPTLRVAELAAKHLKVVLTGDGGDELFAGYEKYQSFFANPSVFDLSDSEFQRRYMASTGLLSLAQKQQLYRGQLASFATTQGEDITAPWFKKVQHWDRINQALYIDTMLLLPGNNLVKPDRMGMAVSLEARTPFLDYRMVEFAFKIPGHLKLKDGETKYIFKKAVRELIGDELAYRKKQMFTVPVGEWMKNKENNSLYDLFQDVLPYIDDCIEKEALRLLWQQHADGLINATREIRACLALGLWRKAFDV
ncbi:MAG: asparagine synthase (glutamine-hydrolyzing) [Agitococcus sp.]|nr:asparagine synthase (glutamine-hydrolyzing) [Agitococcus sp.]